MHESPYKLHRIASDRHLDLIARADRARLLADLRLDPPGQDRFGRTHPRPRDLRWRAADTLLALAARVSPAHRDALRALRPPTGAPRAG